jgi:hypothetical protein
MEEEFMAEAFKDYRCLTLIALNPADWKKSS